MSTCPRRTCPFSASFVAGICAWMLLVGLPAHATIGVAYQMLLGNPTGATADTNNHNHYLIQRAVQALDYNDTLRQPNWASWHYTTNDSGSASRSSVFFVDTNLPANFYRVLTSDLGGSGYDRGHMCPSADRTDTDANNDATFYMSNIIPQAPDNNQGIWANLENYSRALAASNEVLVLCGPQGFGTNKTDSTGQIPIASNVWKIIVAVPLGAGSTLSRITNSTRVIAVNIPNIQGIYSDPWQNYLIRREVLPYTPDAWVDEAATKIGYEVSFTRVFYKPAELRTLDQIRQSIVDLEKETEGLLGEIVKGGAA